MNKCFINGLLTKVILKRYRVMKLSSLTLHWSIRDFYKFSFIWHTSDFSVSYLQWHSYSGWIGVDSNGVSEFIFCLDPICGQDMICSFKCRISIDISIMFASVEMSWPLNESDMWVKYTKFTNKTLEFFFYSINFKIALCSAFKQHTHLIHTKVFFLMSWKVCWDLHNYSEIIHVTHQYFSLVTLTFGQTEYNKVLPAHY